MVFSIANLSPWIDIEDARLAVSRSLGKGIRIAVIDSGIEVSHPELAGLKLADDIHIADDNLKIAVREGDGLDVYGHGTAVAGILRRLAPEAEIGSFRVLGEKLVARTAIISAGVRQAIERGYHILNCSFGCGVPDHVLHYKAWIDEAYLRGIHVVAACNNFDESRPEWPGFFPSVVTCNMASTADEYRIFYKPGSLVEFATRGVDVCVPWMGHTVKQVTGSSFAAPRASALLARLLSGAPDLHPLAAKSILHHLAETWIEDLRAPNAPA